MPAVLLAGLSPLVQASTWLGSPTLDILLEGIATFAAFGVVIAGLIRYGLHRTRLLLFLSLGFLAAAFLDTVHVTTLVTLVNLDLDVQASLEPEIWAAGRALLAILLLTGFVFDRLAPFVRRALIEVVVATAVVLAVATIIALTFLIIDLPLSGVRILGVSQPEQLYVGLLYVSALPFYFHIYRRHPNKLWLSVVVALVVSIFGQWWIAGSRAHNDLSFVAAHIAKAVVSVGVLTGFQLLGTESEREALTAARQRGLLLEVARAASKSGTDVSRMLDHVARAIAGALGVVRVAILVPEPDGQAVRIMGGHDMRREFAGRLGALLPLESIPALNDAVTRGVVSHMRADERDILDPKILADILHADIRAVTIVPLVVGGGAVGVIAISSPEADWRLPLEDEPLAQAIASQVATTLENARLLALQQQQAAIETTLYRAVASLNADLEPDEVLGEAAAQLRQALDSPVCAVSSWDPVRRVAASRMEVWKPGLEPGARPKQPIRLSDSPLLHQVIDRQEVVAVYAADPRPEVAGRELLQALQRQALLIVPLVDKGRTVGIAEIYEDRLSPFRQQEIELVQALALQAGAALQRARLYHLERDRAAQLSVLNWLAQVVTGPIPEEATLDESVRRLSLALRGAQTVLVYVRESGRESLRLSASLGLPGRLVRSRAVKNISIQSVGDVLSPDNPVAMPGDWGESNPTALARATGLGRLDPLVGVAVYVEGELTMLVVFAFAPHSLPGEREEDFLLTLSASLSQSLTARRLFEGIAAERERLRAILASTGEAVVLTTGQATIALLNPAAERLFGLDQQTVAGRTLDEVFSHPVFKDFAARMRGGRIKDIVRAEITLDDGRALLTSVAPVRSAAGKAQGYVIDMADITELQSLSEQKSQMLRMASHDLLNPLGQAIGAFDLLLESLAGRDQLTQELVNNVQMGHQRMHRLITGLLDLERLEAGRLGERKIISVESLVREVVQEMEPRAAGRKHTLQVHLPSGLPEIKVDVTQVQRALSNLVENAIKYTAPGGTILVRAEKAVDKVRIDVVDNGPGILPEDQPKLFQRFFRAHHPDAEGVPGTGLGLSLVKSVAELHGGAVSFRSVPGKGSTFTITLPATRKKRAT